MQNVEISAALVVTVGWSHKLLLLSCRCIDLFSDLEVLDPQEERLHLPLATVCLLLSLGRRCLSEQGLNLYLSIRSNQCIKGKRYFKVCPWFPVGYLDGL